MQIELDQRLLTAPARDDLVLLGLCAFGLTERHRIVPDDRTTWDRWTMTFPADLRDEVHLAWDYSGQRVAIGGPSERIVVSMTDDYRATPLVLTPIEALSFLGRPLRVLLENGRYDRAFILAFADVATRKALEDAEHDGWVVFETAGGISELMKRAEAAMGSAPREVYRTMYLCDSDAREPGALSDQAAAIERHLTSLAGRFQRPAARFGTVLRRRAAENYAPPGNVLAWASMNFGPNARLEITRATSERQMLTNGTGNPGSSRRLLLAAIALAELRERPNVRGFLDMKEGRLRQRAGQPDLVRTVDTIWNALDDLQQAALNDGFGAGFSGDFYGGQRGLRDETGEIAGLLDTILERI